jgi:hypothetical protein
MTSKKLTSEQEKGLKFEIWLEELLRGNGYKPRRNVEYHKSKQGKRQVDIIYRVEKEGRFYTAMIEAKYSSNGTIPNKLRSPKTDKKTQLIYPIKTIVEDLIDRNMFIKKYFSPFDYIFLVTNKSLDDEARSSAKKNRITVVEGDILTKMHLKMGGKGSIEDSINAIDFRRYILLPTNEYAR